MGPNYIPTSTWATYKDILDKAYSDFAKKVITHLSYVSYVDLHKEDSNEVPEYTSSELEVLMNYNYMRTWPITQSTTAGELDRQSIQILINKEYLRTIGKLSPDGNFLYNPDFDRFIIDGQYYKGKGDTAVSQANADDILFAIIVTREEHPSDTFKLR